MAIKKAIIHFVRNGKYLCNQAAKPTKEKSTRERKKVTCKNCKVILKKELKKVKK